jgi:hypothetical protein
MKIIISVLFIFVIVIGARLSVKAQSCEVADPTGTMLNVRAKPNGRIVSKLPNGAKIWQEDFLYDSLGREWLKVGIYRGKKYTVLGWVLKDLLSCE